MSDTVADTLAIQSVKALYCEAADLLPVDATRAAEGLRGVFAADATADYGNGILDGREAIVEFLVSNISTARDWLWHAIHTPYVEVEGDEAVGRWTIVAMMRDKGKTAVERAYGRYDNRFIRTSQGWRILSMRWIEEVRD